MSQQGLRVALIGVGNHGSLFPTILEHSGRGSKIVALVDINPKALKEVGEAMGVPECARFFSIQELLEKFWAGIDAAIVATPAHERLPAIQCLEEGIPIFIENPMSLNYAEAMEILRLSLQTVCTVDEQWVKLPAVEEMFAEDEIEARIGKIREVVISGKGRSAWTEFVRIGTHLLHVAHHLVGAGIYGCSAVALKSGFLLKEVLPDPDVIRATFTVIGSCASIHGEFLQAEQPDVRRCYIELRGTKGRARAIGGLLEQVWASDQPFDTGDCMNHWQRIYPRQEDIDIGAWEIIRPGKEPRALLNPAMNPTFKLWQGFENACEHDTESPNQDDQATGRWNPLSPNHGTGGLISIAAACEAMVESIKSAGSYVRCNDFDF